ncbi:PEP-CTERM sorting domain-containing protein [Comamonadaceae bacterium G21597-S1]|nr:PEP-CTERM sorting domain-containing protein [Comamonadaceae bacterium G21597-S1]
MSIVHTSFRIGVGAVLALVLSVLSSVPASAALLTYSFNGITSAGSVLDLGGGPVDVGGIAVSITGTTTTDVDLTAVGDGLGLFAATSTYDFGALGSFTTDVGGDTYFQDCSSPTGITCVGMFNGASGFLLGFPEIVGDPDFGMPIGTPAGGFLVGSEFRFLQNGSGNQMFLSIDALTAASIQSVPEPGTLALVGLGLFYLGSRYRAKR